MKKRAIVSSLAVVLGWTALTSTLVQAEDDYPYAYNYPDNWSQSVSYQDYAIDYRRLEAEHQQLITEYKQLKQAYDQRYGNNDLLAELQTQSEDLRERFKHLQASNPVIGGDYRITNLESKVQHYEIILQNLTAETDFLGKNRNTLVALDHLDAERAKLIGTWNASYDNYQRLNTNLLTTNTYIRDLNIILRSSSLQSDRNQYNYTQAKNLQEEILKKLASIESTNYSRERQSPDPRRSERYQNPSTEAPDTDYSTVPLWKEMRNEGDNKVNYVTDDYTYDSRVDLTNIYDLKTLQEKSDEAHRRRAKEILFTFRQSDLHDHGDLNLSDAISTFVKEKLSVTPNARGTTSGFKWLWQGYHDADDITVTLMPQYYMTDAQYWEYRDHIKKWTQENIKATDNEVAKIEKIQDYIMTNYHYATGKVGSFTRTGISVQTPYAFIKDNEAVCQAYAQMFKDMGQLAGLDVYYIQGYGDPVGGLSSLHAWNIVKVNGRYYHVDLTWNDTIDNTNKNHTYTLRGNNFMRKTHLWNAAYNISNEDYFPYTRTVSPGYTRYADRVLGNQGPRAYYGQRA
ncbi:transglutaminase domain-containing protein [Streptococcus phocae subsp. salmonis]|uniref:transglutaminase domain-containing protein n=1 Tax=Streptococcus phocae TaxID=119224 RepID=UPI000AAC027E|nr:transglutaminase domain-containing protein [Streptococcus phocae]